MYQTTLLTALLFLLQLPLKAQSTTTALNGVHKQTVIIQFDERASIKVFAEIKEKVRNNSLISIASTCSKQNIICFDVKGDNTQALENMLHEIHVGYDIKKDCSDAKIVSCDEGEGK